MAFIRILFAVLHMQISKYFVVLFCSVSAVKCKFRCTVLKSVRMAYMFVWLETKMRISST